MALLKINLNFHEDDIADWNDAKMYHKLDHATKIKDMILQSLNNVFKQLDSKLVDDCKGQVKYLLDLANKTKDVTQSIAILDTTKLAWLANGNASERVKTIHSIKDLHDWCNDKKESATRPLYNVCLLVKLPSNIVNDYNTICFFCNLNFTYDHDMTQLSLDLKRIELINLKDNLSKKQFSLNLNDSKKYIDDPEVIKNILTWNQLIAEDNANLNTYLNINDWKRFLAALRIYYQTLSGQRKDTNGQDTIFWLDDTLITLGKSYECYILQPKINHLANFNVSSSKQYYLVKKQVLKKPTDIPDVYYNAYINLKQDNQLNNLIKDINKKCIMINGSLMQTSNDIKDKEAQLKNIQSSMNELANSLQVKQSAYNEATKSLDVLRAQLNAKQNEVNALNNQLARLNYENAHGLQVDQLQNQLTVATNELVELRNKCNFAINNKDQLNSIVQQLTNQVTTNNIRIQELVSEINKQRMLINTYKQANEKYSKLITTLKNSNYDCKKVSFVLAEDQKIAFEPFTITSSIKSFFNGFNFSNYYFDEFDFWGLVSSRRLNGYIFSLLQGFYKNPFLLQKLINPTSLKVRIDNQINPVITNSFKLNKLQTDAIKKAINIEDYFYLQGPPGTGKTQTICAVADQYILEHKTILMASQSHEAINNFFDRLDDINYQNPKLMLIKYIPDKQKDLQNKYNVDSSWHRFLQKSMNYCQDPNRYLKDLSIINKWIEDQYVLPAFFTNQELIFIKNNLVLIEKTLDTTRFANVANDYKKALKDNKLDAELFNLINNKQLKQIGNQTWLNQYDDLIVKLNKVIKESRIFNDLETLRNAYLAICNHNEYIDLFKRQYLDPITEQSNANKFNFFHKQPKDKAKDLDPILINKLEFIEYINKNKLINVFGITMAASPTISILKKDDSDLFYDWPIDLVIIDEISKSIAPEIIGRILLAKKVIFAGDYKQLPPMCEYHEDECKQLVTNPNFTNKFCYKGSSKVYDPNNEDDDEKAQQLFQWVNNLYQTSFFKKEVSVFKHEHHLATVPYQFLTKQHRFCSSIMNVVNTFYDDNEKLTMPDPSKIFNEYNLNLLSLQDMKQTLADPCLIIDTSYLDPNIQAYFANKFGINSKVSFDTVQWEDTTYNSHVNPYNGIVIIDLIYQLLTNNPNLHPNQIGVITMTKSEKQLIDKLLKDKIINQGWDEAWKEVKIDTVDNFQGREKEIIILDFVRSYGELSDHEVKQKARDVRFYFVNERNNVAISRAQAKLIIVGSFANHYLDLKTIMNSEAMKPQYEFLKQVYQNINKKVASKDILWPKM